MMPLARSKCSWWAMNGSPLTSIRALGMAVVSGRKRVHRQESLWRTIEAGRVVGHGAAGETCCNGASTGRRRPEHAEAVQCAARRHKVANARAAALGARAFR